MNSENSAIRNPQSAFKKLRVLIIEDSEDDTLLLLRELRKGGYGPVYERAETAEAMMTALGKEEWDIVISDYVLPKFSGLAALDVLRESGQDLPFIIVSGNIGEDIAVGAMKAGAHDYIIKGNLKRLIPAIERELREAEMRKERKKAEEALSVFKNLINQSSDSIFVVDPKTAGLLEINDSVCINLGYSREELLTMRVIDFAEKQQDLSTWRAYAKKIKEKGNIVLEDRLMRKDRTVFPVEISVRHISHKEKDYHVAIVRDITERRETESRITLGNAFLKLFSQTFSRKEYLDSAVKLISDWTGCRCIGIRMLDKNGDIPYEAFTGFSKEFWEKENFLSIKKDQCACTRIISEKPDPHELSLVTSNGSFYTNNSLEFINSLTDWEKARFRGNCIKNGFMSISIIPVRYGEKVLGGIHLADERKGMAQRKIIESLEAITPLIGEAIYRFNIEEERSRLAAAVESTADAVLITDPDWLIRYANPAFMKITGYKRDEIIGQNIQILQGSKQDDIFYADIVKTLAQGKVWKGHGRSRKKDGTLYEEDSAIAPLRSSSGEILNYVFVNRDVTETLRLESIAQSVNTMNNIGYVFSGIRHEIGNPINSIKMTLSVLKRNFDKYDKANILEYVERALSESQRVEYLLKTLKNFNMYETPDFQNIDMRTFLDNFRNLVKGDLCLKKGIDFRVSFEQGAEFCYADPRALQQILLNICNNAAEALDTRPDPRIEIKVIKISDMILIRVGDNGAGMSRGEYMNLFKPFYTSKEHGTGLGLVIVKKMLASMNGIIEIDSQKDKGTIVDIMIPEAKYD